MWKQIFNLILITNLILALKSSENTSNTSTTSTQSTKEMKINSNLLVTGNISSGDITANDLKITGLLEVKNMIKTKQIKSNLMHTNTLLTKLIKSQSGVLTIQGDLILNNEVSSGALDIRATSFIMQDVKQWTLNSHDDFESKESLEGWSDKRTNYCKGKTNRHLGGHCNFGFMEVYKIYKNLRDHENLRVNAAYHMFDSWDGETAYMKIDGEIVWSKQGQHTKKGINICGGDYNDPAFNM